MSVMIKPTERSMLLHQFHIPGQFHIAESRARDLSCVRKFCSMYDPPLTLPDAIELEVTTDGRGGWQVVIWENPDNESVTPSP